LVLILTGQGRESHSRILDYGKACPTAEEDSKPHPSRGAKDEAPAIKHLTSLVVFACAAGAATGV